MLDLKLARMFIQNHTTHWISRHYLTSHLLFSIFLILQHPLINLVLVLQLQTYFQPLLL